MANEKMDEKKNRKVLKGGRMEGFNKMYFRQQMFQSERGEESFFSAASSNPSIKVTIRTILTSLNLHPSHPYSFTFTIHLFMPVVENVLLPDSGYRFLRVNVNTK